MTIQPIEWENHTDQENVPHFYIPEASTDPLSQEEWEVFWALGDTVIAAVVPPDHPDAKDPTKAILLSESDYNAYSKSAASLFDPNTGVAEGPVNSPLVRHYLAERISSLPDVRARAKRLIGALDPLLVFQLRWFLWCLRYRAGTFLFTQRTTSWLELPVLERARAFHNWARSSLSPLRFNFKAMTATFRYMYTMISPTYFRAIGFPRIPVHGPIQPGYNFSFLQFPPLPESFGGLQSKMITDPRIARPDEEVIETDVVIVGSGCGGGVVAKRLAEKGFKVIVVDKGYHFSSAHFPLSPDEGMSLLYMKGSPSLDSSANIAILAGQTWGGGGTVNWSASLQPQGAVREEWANISGLPFFTSYEFQNCLDIVCRRMGVSDEHIQHNHGNLVLLEGARRLGWAHRVVPQNTNGEKHYCGSCSLGCHSAHKMGPSNSFLPDAAQHEANFIEGFDVDQIIFSDRRRKRAIGVRGEWTSRDEHGGLSSSNQYRRKLFIKAKRVVISAGSLQTPAILLRSGLNNPHVGAHLRLHPTVFVMLVYDYETRPWEGGILTSVVSEFENMDKKFHGVKVEGVSMVPSVSSLGFLWQDPLSFKLKLLKLRYMAGYIALCRDSSEGQITISKDGMQSHVAYKTNSKDLNHLREGVVATAKLGYITGAREIHPPHPLIEPWVRQGPVPASAHLPTPVYPDPHRGPQPPRILAPDKNETRSIDPGINDPSLKEFCSKVRDTDLDATRVTLGSAHQMGSCRMGSSPAVGAVDGNGLVWGTENLYVADASLFPSASGVNPMVTTMGLSWFIGGRIAESLEAGSSTPFANRAHL